MTGSAVADRGQRRPRRRRRTSSAPGLPPGCRHNKHQLALMIWLAVFPTLLVLNLLLGDWLGEPDVRAHLRAGHDRRPDRHLRPDAPAAPGSRPAARPLPTVTVTSDPSNGGGRGTPGHQQDSPSPDADIRGWPGPGFAGRLDRMGRRRSRSSRRPRPASARRRCWPSGSPRRPDGRPPARGSRSTSGQRPAAFWPYVVAALRPAAARRAASRCCSRRRPPIDAALTTPAQRAAASTDVGWCSCSTTTT